MEWIQNVEPFRRGRHQVSVIHTDLAEAEAIVKQMAQTEKTLDPGDFGGKTACVYFKMPYIPPCDAFKELRRLILRIRENTGLRANYKGVVAIEVTEWIGHESEEYFTVLLKYLYDHSDLWKTAMILNQCTEGQIQRFLAACARYITPKLFSLRLFSDPGVLCSQIRMECEVQGGHISADAAQMLAAAIGCEELKSARSMALIRRSVGELLSCVRPEKTVTAGQVRDYLADPCSALAMMVPRFVWMKGA